MAYWLIVVGLVVVVLVVVCNFRMIGTLSELVKELRQEVTVLQHTSVLGNQQLLSILSKSSQTLDIDSPHWILDNNTIKKFFTPGKLVKVENEEEKMSYEFEQKDNGEIACITKVSGVVKYKTDISPFGAPLRGFVYDKTGEMTDEYIYDNLGQITKKRGQLMFINELHEAERENFLGLAHLAMMSDGAIEEEEIEIFNNYKYECMLEDYEYKNQTIDQLLDGYKESSLRHKKIVLIELMGIWAADDSWDDGELEMMYKVGKAFGLEEREVSRLRLWTRELSFVIQDGYELLAKGE